MENQLEEWHLFDTFQFSTTLTFRHDNLLGKNSKKVLVISKKRYLQIGFWLKTGFFTPAVENLRTKKSPQLRGKTLANSRTLHQTDRDIFESGGVSARW